MYRESINQRTVDGKGEKKPWRGCVPAPNPPAPNCPPPKPGCLDSNLIVLDSNL